jgi:hypothetical protein
MQQQGERTMKTVLKKFFCKKSAHTCSCSKSQHTASGSKFPEQELKQWLHKRIYWDHDAWLNLLKDLHQQGYSCYTDSADGRAQIGQYLEANREKF